MTKRGSSITSRSRAVVGDGQFDVRLAVFGAVAGQHELAFAEGEFDAAALLAGDDGRLPDRGVERADRQFDLGEDSWRGNTSRHLGNRPSTRRV